MQLVLAGFWETHGPEISAVSALLAVISIVLAVISAELRPVGLPKSRQDKLHDGSLVGGARF